MEVYAVQNPKGTRSNTTVDINLFALGTPKKVAVSTPPLGGSRTPPAATPATSTRVTVVVPTFTGTYDYAVVSQILQQAQ